MFIFFYILLCILLCFVLDPISKLFAVLNDLFHLSVGVELLSLKFVSVLNYTLFLMLIELFLTDIPYN